MHQTAERLWAWQGGAGALIWQLMFLSSGRIAGLKRFPDARSASFFCIDPVSGEAVCDNFVLTSGGDADLPVGDGWMTGIETVHEELLIAHGYHAGSPEHLGIWAIDLPSGRVAWSRPECVFTAHLGGSILAYRPRGFAGLPEREYLLLDPPTGRTLEELGLDHDRPNRLRSEAEPEDLRQGILLPDVARIGSGLIETIPAGRVRIEAVHCPESDGGPWSSAIRVMDGDTLLYTDLMAEKEPMPPLDNFLTRGGSLYYIKGKEQLISVGIP